MRRSVFLRTGGFLLAVIYPCLLLAAPLDFNGDGVSDPAAVTVDPDNSKLDWTALISGTSTSLRTSFGKDGNVLAPADYTGNNTTEVAHVNSSGNWFVSVDGSNQRFTHGEEGATYLTGADGDGDGRADAIHYSRRCRNKNIVVNALFNPLDATPLSNEFRGLKGTFMVTYGDVNGNGRDDLCQVAPLKKNDQLSGRFRMICRDMLTGSRVAKFKVGQVFGQPIPLRVPGATARFAFPKTKNGNTTVRIFSTDGQTVKKGILFGATNSLIAGNFTNTDAEPEQLAMLANGTLVVYDIDSDSFANVTVPSGTLLNEFQDQTFEEDLDRCLCTTRRINNTGRCAAVRASGCQVDREITDGGGNFLHKPVSDSTGSIVNLFNPADSPTSCQYERGNGEVFREAFFSGNTNPNRPTWRPVGGGSCSGFPSPLVVACQVNNRKNCWTIPDPCERFD